MIAIFLESIVSICVYEMQLFQGPRAMPEPPLDFKLSQEKVTKSFVNININEMQAVNFGGNMGWMIWADEEQVEPLIESIL